MALGISVSTAAGAGVRICALRKLVDVPRRRLVGATVSAPGGGEAITELTAWVARGELDDGSRAVPAYPTYAEGPARAADRHITAHYLSPRVRALTRPILATLRVLERAR